MVQEGPKILCSAKKLIESEQKGSVVRGIEWKRYQKKNNQLNLYRNKPDFWGPAMNYNEFIVQPEEKDQKGL